MYLCALVTFSKQTRGRGLQPTLNIPLQLPLNVSLLPAMLPHPQCESLSSTECRRAAAVAPSAAGPDGAGAHWREWQRQRNEDLANARAKNNNNEILNSTDTKSRLFIALLWQRGAQRSKGSHECYEDTETLTVTEPEAEEAVTVVPLAELALLAELADVAVDAEPVPVPL